MRTAGLSRIKLKVLKHLSKIEGGKKIRIYNKQMTGEEYLEEPSRQWEENLSQNPTSNMFEKNDLDILNREKSNKSMQLKIKWKPVGGEKDRSSVVISCLKPGCCASCDLSFRQEQIRSSQNMLGETAKNTCDKLLNWVQRQSCSLSWFSLAKKICRSSYAKRMKGSLPQGWALDNSEQVM